MQVWSLVWEDPLQEGTATHPSIVAWRIPWTEEPGGLQSMGWSRVRSDIAQVHPFLVTVLSGGARGSLVWHGFQRVSVSKSVSRVCSLVPAPFHRFTLKTPKNYPVSPHLLTRFHLSFEEAPPVLRTLGAWAAGGSTRAQGFAGSPGKPLRLWKEK